MLCLPATLSLWNSPSRYALPPLSMRHRVGACNSTEDYELHVDSKGNKEVSVTFTYQGNFNEKPKQLFQKAKVISETGTQWAISPYVLGVALPLGLPYLVLDCGKNYEYTVIGMPQRQYLCEQHYIHSCACFTCDIY